MMRCETRGAETEECEDSGAVDEPESMVEISLAKIPRKFVSLPVKGLLTLDVQPRAVEYHAIYTSSLNT